jgi:hypothetical protein
MNHYGISTVEYETFGDYEPTKLVLDKLPDSFLDQNADELVETPLGAMMNVKKPPKGMILKSRTTKFFHNPPQLSRKTCVTVPTTLQAADEFTKSIFSPNAQSITHLMIQNI